MARKRLYFLAKPRGAHGMALAITLTAAKLLESRVSLNGIAQTALSALQTNSTALRVIGNNVANMNTQGYARRIVNLQAQSTGGTLTGVDIASIQRVTDQFLTAETLSAGGSSGRYDTQSSIYQQLDSLLGQPGDKTSLTSQLTAVSTALGQAALSPTASASQQGVLNSIQSLASTISTLSSSITGLQTQVDQQVGSNIGTVNSLVKQIFDLNGQIRTEQVQGDTDSGLLDQRDTAIQNLSKYVGVRQISQPDGTVSVMTTDGINLVGDSYTQLSYTPGGSNGTYSPITFQNINPTTGSAIGPAQDFDSHLDSGSLKGLLDMRDGTLASVNAELGNLAQQTAQAYNTQHNANAAFPPPTTLTGRDTGLLSGDALNFTGKTTIAVTDPNGNLVSRVDVDFDAGTISVDGGAATSFTGTVGGFTTALNSALGSNGSASFTDGTLTVSATGGNGIVTQDDATTPASRGGAGFAQFFGLNDLFRSAVPSITATGLSATDASGLAAGTSFTLQLKGPSGDIPKQATVNITAGMSVGAVVAAMNTAMGGQATFTLNPDGSISESQPSSLTGYSLNVTADTTQRGTTGISFTEMFGIGANTRAQQAQNFEVNPQIAASPQRLSFAQGQITAATTVGGTVVTHGDSSGLNALQALDAQKQSFASAGNIAGEVATLSDYGAAFYQDIATSGTQAQANQTSQDDRLQEAQTRQQSNSGVNLDEELSNMVIYQQAYSAGARLLTTVQNLWDTLLQIPAT